MSALPKKTDFISRFEFSFLCFLSFFYAVSRGDFLFTVRKIIIITVNRKEFSMKYKDWLDVWFANYIEPSSKTKTCERYSEIIEKHLKVKLGEYELEELSPIVIQKYITELMQSGNLTTGKGLAANSVNGIITVIQNSLKLAYTLGELKEYTADKIRRPKTKEKEVSCFSLAEQKKIALLSRPTGSAISKRR